jgi:hypothetical protein
VFSTGLALKDQLIDPLKARAIMENGKTDIVYISQFLANFLTLGRIETLIDAIPTPRHKFSIDHSLLFDEKDRLQQIKNLEKIKKTIFNDYKSKFNHSIYIGKLNSAERIYLAGSRSKSKAK